ncbi:helix-turn-helix domain-containing protein [Bacillus toyonensis]|uniref:ATP-binding protein n=1 Tax=Bacillus toyonensis TaxID=155322 RepID=A0ABX6G8D7_9BACI|nr:ATP-binding protein [Bacillus toyonensis]MED2706602.1 ATP-binding protein [Bacillus toyonensis]MED2737890.1 ATP-binding protein [Bacillus toyonensis]QHA15996.1 ATP-binding protein [Bacillus toyonensis]
MSVSKQQFFELYRTGREDDQCDFKEELHLKSKEHFYAFLKDLLAFSNSDGGYLLLGVEDKTLKLVGVKEKIDESNLGEKIEATLGYALRFNLFYFEYEGKDETIVLGIMYIHQGEKINVSPKTLNGPKKVIVQENTIYVRRNTRSVNANREDFEKIGHRINSASEYEFKERDLMILEHNKEHSDSLGIKLDKYIRGEFVFTSNEFSYKLNEIYRYQVKYNKLEFARLLGFENHRIDDYFEGKVFPTLEHILRATTIFNLPPDYFFTPTLHMQYPIWQKSLVSYCIIEKMKHKDDLFNYDKKKFFSSVLWQLAGGMRTLSEWLYSERISIQGVKNSKPTYKYIDNHYLYACVNHMNDMELDNFKKHLERQYYKVLEYCPNDGKMEGDLLVEEQILNILTQVNTKLVCRIIVESIEGIQIHNGEVEVRLHFLEDIINGKSVRRHYLPDTLSLECIEG